MRLFHWLPIILLQWRRVDHVVSQDTAAGSEASRVINPILDDTVEAADDFSDAKVAKHLPTAAHRVTLLSKCMCFLFRFSFNVPRHKFIKHD